MVWDMYTYYLHMVSWYLLLTVVVLLTIGQIVSGELTWEVIWYPLVFGGGFLAMYGFGYGYTRWRFGKAQEAFGMGDVMVAPILALLLGLTIPV